MDALSLGGSASSMLKVPLGTSQSITVNWLDNSTDRMWNQGLQFQLSDLMQDTPRHTKKRSAEYAWSGAPTQVLPLPYCNPAATPHRAPGANQQPLAATCPTASPFIAATAEDIPASICFAAITDMEAAVVAGEEESSCSSGEGSSRGPNAAMSMEMEGE
eukprot:1157832-Pelagomonas_calceolata.AAC.3